MGELVLQAKLRELTKKEACGRYRRDGFIPAVIYGQGKNVNILIHNLDFIKAYPKLSRATIITLKVDNTDYSVLIKDYEKSYLKDRFVHIDFYELNPNKPVTLNIPLEFIGTPAGIRDGGIFEKHLIKIEVACLPKDILPAIKVNVADLKLNSSLHVKDIELDKKYKVISHADEVVVTITASQKEEAAQETTPAPAAAKTEKK
ncbi:MAG: hypothetical protein A2086_01890 [Spirochaetes bacterium GWD1_27_9]|nr:MAG: hypothetical protein A2Z98_07980 [Spirochaetes bacterium GWB1_27_13]OHD23993.1 MAG: hypothetical protein A2Y34_10485 [Spirochaetes bacterium GWC1_27_15]OHD41613.1 MAG: hypothetical protein A2086_01890 [Spirochaetes bacterium GWD1_27_9]